MMRFDEIFANCTVGRGEAKAAGFARISVRILGGSGEFRVSLDALV
jgi:hypothetical protein